MSKTNLIFDDEKLQKSSDLMRALAHPLRLKILEFIDKNKEINVNKIYSSLRIEQSITSQHLRILRSSGIVDTVRDGKYIHYKIDYDKIENARKAIQHFLVKSGQKKEVLVTE
ncbi:MAG: helix-turn-helix transcriptional regulator [Saprospiraceae bacterium]|nr:helix-turn-helix transcriptional regulator [Saprospiraceae bacterium]